MICDLGSAELAGRFDVGLAELAGRCRRQNIPVGRLPFFIYFLSVSPPPSYRHGLICRLLISEHTTETGLPLLYICQGWYSVVVVVVIVPVFNCPF